MLDFTELWVIIPAVHVIPFWYHLIAQMPLTLGVVFLGNGFMYSRMLPFHYKPVTPKEQKQYRALLYSYSRPMREIWLDMLRALAFTMPIVVVVVLYLIVCDFWPMYTDPALIIGAIAITIALFALVKYYLLPQRAKSEAWYAEHFPNLDDSI